MANSVKDIMFALVRRAVCGDELSESVKEQITPELLKELYALSKPQDIAHIIAEALLCENLLPEGEIKSVYSKERMTAVFRYAQIRHELSRIYTALDGAKIKYMPLKGSVIRSYYPKPELRTSCDIDILVNPSDLDDACAVITDTLGYTFDTRSAHDVSLYSPGKTHLELHFDLFESEDEELNSVLSRIWDMAHAAENSYRYELDADMFAAYHIAHMAKHFSSGGCGARPFIDLWIIKNKMGYSKKNVTEILSECSLSYFGEQAMLLSDIWMDGADYTDVTLRMEKYILGTFIYGTIESHVAIKKSRSGGGFAYCMNRLFMPYSKLKKMYPRLDKYPILYPYYQVKRWIRFFLRGRLFYAKEEIRAASSKLSDEEKSTVKLCQDLGLK